SDVCSSDLSERMQEDSFVSDCGASSPSDSSTSFSFLSLFSCGCCMGATRISLLSGGQTGSGPASGLPRSYSISSSSTTEKCLSLRPAKTPRGRRSSGGCVSRCVTSARHSGLPSACLSWDYSSCSSIISSPTPSKLHPGQWSYSSFAPSSYTYF